MTEFAPHELFVQLAGGSLPRRGGDIVVCLRGAAIGEDDIELQAIVSRQRWGEVCDQGFSRGIEVRIIEAPPEYHALFGDLPTEDTTEVEILVEVLPSNADLPALAGRGDPLTAFLERDLATPGIPARGDRLAPLDADVDLPSAREPASLDADWPAQRDDVVAVGFDQAERSVGFEAAPPRSEEVAAEGPEPTPAASANLSAPPLNHGSDPRAFGSPIPSSFADQSDSGLMRAANAIVVYDGEKLADVYELLEQIGARPERARLSGPTRFRGWDLPPKMVIVDAQDALSIDLPQNLIEDGVVRIAVANSASAVIGKMLRSQGFHYLVRRPVHREALEVLLRGALHRGIERRSEERSPIGIDARLVTSLWRWPAVCTLLELSAMGGRVVTREDIPLLSPVSLKISRAVSGTRPISLRARVVRRRQNEEEGEWSLALRFLEVPAAQRGRLDDLLTRAAVGPTSPLVERPATRLRSWWQSLRRRGRSPQPVLIPSEAQLGLDPEVLAPQPIYERRDLARGTLDGEVVTLDERCERVTAVLMGRDLSTMGMRVDPHPEFFVGRQMVVALYDSVSRGAIEIVAEVVRDDGDRGLGLRFTAMKPECAARLEKLVAVLPAVESLSPGNRPLMVARITPASSTESSETPGEARDGQPDASGDRSRDVEIASQDPVELGREPAADGDNDVPNRATPSRRPRRARRHRSRHR